MLMPDVNVLVYAHRVEAPEHERYVAWLRELASGGEPFALSNLVAAGFVRVVTHTNIWKAPTPPEIALDFVARLRQRSTCRNVEPGSECWRIFSELVRATGAKGKLVADAHHAAIAIEHGCEMVSADGDFSRFPGLRHRHPLAPAGGS